MCTAFAQRAEAEAEAEAGLIDLVDLPPLRGLSLNSNPFPAGSEARRASAHHVSSFFDDLLRAEPSRSRSRRPALVPGFFAASVLATLQLEEGSALDTADADADANPGFAAMQHDIVGLGLADATEDPPPFSYAAMTCHAITCLGTEPGAGAGAGTGTGTGATSAQIYRAIMQQFGYYRAKRDNGWRQTVRSTLSANPSFTKHRVAQTGRSVTYAWRVDDPLSRKHITFGRVRRRYTRRPTRPRSPCGKPARQ